MKLITKNLAFFFFYSLGSCRSSQEINNATERKLFLYNLHFIQDLKEEKKIDIDSLYSAIVYLTNKTNIQAHIDINHINPYPDTFYLNYDFKAWKNWYTANKRKLLSTKSP